MSVHRRGRNWLLWSSAAGAALLSLGAMTGRASAQDNGSTTLEEVVVDGGGQGRENGGKGPVKGYVAKDTTSGSKTATPIKEVPQAVSVVGQEEIQDRGAQKVDEALRYTAGVFPQAFGVDSDTNWIYVRGFDATLTGAYQDGLQLQGFAFGTFYIDPFSLERIEVLKGPASVLYGGSNPGGVVNYVSKRPTEASFTRIETGIDSFGVGYVGFDVDGDGGPAAGSDGTQGGVDYRVAGRLYGGKGYFDEEEQFRGVLSPSITWSPDAATSLTVLANYTHMDNLHGVNSFLPYDATVRDDIATFGRIPRDFNSTEPDVDNYDREQASIGYEFSHEFDNGWTFRQNSRVSYADLQERYLYGNGLATNAQGDTVLNRVDFQHDTQATNYLLDNQIEGKFDTGAVNHTLLAGIDYKYYKIDQVQAAGLFGTTPPIDPTDPDYGVSLPDPVSYIDQDVTQNQVGVYAQDQLRFGNGWLVTLNGRYDQFWTSIDNDPNFYNPAPTDPDDVDDGQLSGRAGLAYNFDNGVTPYASVATFFNPLVGADFFGNPYKAEEGEQFEVGVKYQPTWIDGLFTVSLFDLTRRNVVTTLEGNPFGNVQVGEIQSRGFEAEAKVNLTDNIKMTAAVTAFDLEVTEDDDATIIGKQPVLIPNAQASLFLDYTFREGALDGVTVGAGVRYQNSSFADRLNEFKVPSATVADAKIGYKQDNWGVDLVVTNLFDKEYVQGCQGVNVCSYAESRKALLKANFEW